MEIMKKINELISMVESEDKVKIGEIIISLTEYVSFVAENEAKAHIKSERSKDTEKEIEERYKRCISDIKVLNKMSSELLGEKIYDKEFNRDEVEKFMKELLSEIFENRRISRK